MGIDNGKRGGTGGKRKRHSKKKVASSAPLEEQVRSSIKTQTNALLNLASFSNPNPKTLGPFSDRQQILVVGDGDFSFSLALAVYFGGRNITATCYDSKSELREKYSNALVNADALETAGANVYFDVDATALEKQPWIHKIKHFNAVAFNFPHLGGATEADVEKNQHLLRSFFYSARPFLHPKQGQVLVALRDTPFYNRWKIEEQAKLSGFKLKRVEAFDSTIYSGYQAQRTHPASYRGEPPSTTGARYFIFVQDFTIHPEDPRLSSTPPKLEEKVPAKEGRINAKPTKKNKAKPDDIITLNCKVCGISFRDSKKFNGHMNSAKHARKVKQQKKGGK